MSKSSQNNQGLSGQKLYIVAAVWLVLVVVGGFCAWFGWFGPGSESSEPTQKAAEATPTTMLAPPPTEAIVVQPTPADQPTPAGGADVPPPTVPPAEEVFGYGIAVHGTGGGAADYWMEQVKSLGLGWVKQQVRWGYFEGNPGEMDWSGYDAVVDEANKKGLKVMLSVVEAPLWTRTYFDDNVEKAPPDDLAVYADFIGRLVDRYKGRVHAIEVWNEQNLDREWDTAEGVSPERYVEMLRLTYQAIKSRDPNIIVISGALSPVGFTCNEPWPDCPDTGRLIIMDDFQYMERMIAAGGLKYCDCVGAHHNGINIPPDVDCDGSYPYSGQQFKGYWDPPQPPNHSWCFKTTLQGYHERIAAAGSDIPLCVTEFGWASAEGLGGDYPQGFEFALDNTQEEQAQWDVQAFQLMRQWGFVRLAFLWNLNYSQLNDGRGGADSNAPYGIIDLSGIARPAFGAIGAMEKP